MNRSYSVMGLQLLDVRPGQGLTRHEGHHTVVLSRNLERLPLDGDAPLVRREPVELVTEPRGEVGQGLEEAAAKLLFEERREERKKNRRSIDTRAAARALLHSPQMRSTVRPQEEGRAPRANRVPQRPAIFGPLRDRLAEVVRLEHAADDVVERDCEMVRRDRSRERGEPGFLHHLGEFRSGDVLTDDPQVRRMVDQPGDGPDELGLTVEHEGRCRPLPVEAEHHVVGLEGTPDIHEPICLEIAHAVVRVGGDTDRVDLRNLNAEARRIVDDRWRGVVRDFDGHHQLEPSTVRDVLAEPCDFITVAHGVHTVEDRREQVRHDQSPTTPPRRVGQNIPQHLLLAQMHMRIVNARQMQNFQTHLNLRHCWG